jgi:hypothetical protein
LPTALDQHLAGVAYRALQDAWLQASPGFWERRARQLEAARPRPGDFNGNRTSAELAEASRRLTEAAQACRNRAHTLDLARDQLDETLVDLGSGARWE